MYMYTQKNIAVILKASLQCLIFMTGAIYILVILYKHWNMRIRHLMERNIWKVLEFSDLSLVNRTETNIVKIYAFTDTQ